MNRRGFFSKAAAGATTALFMPSLLFSRCMQPFTEQELMGIVRPELYGQGYLLRRNAAEAFEQMQAKAAKAGITIKVVSSYRDYDHQSSIWQRKYERYTQQGLAPLEASRKIIEYSTIPGTSRHHWGTDLDIIDAGPKMEGDLLLEKHFYPGAPYHKLWTWLQENAAEFGFYETYTNLPNRKGFKYEPWHFSYLPLSKPMLGQYLAIDIMSKLQEAQLPGSHAFSKQFIEGYIKENIMDINPVLLP